MEDHGRFFGAPFLEKDEFYHSLSSAANSRGCSSYS